MAEIFKTKKLNDGKTLNLVTWVSDSVNPGARMYQLELTGANWSQHHPMNYEDFTKDQIQKMFDSVSSERGFVALRKNQA